MASLLLVEDDASLRDSLTLVLAHEGHDVTACADAEAALALALPMTADLVVLDVGLPGMDGLRLCRRLRDQGRTAPILMLTARHAVDDRVRGLDAGADDYLVKPFALDELLARVRALLRRRPASTSTHVGLDDLRVDLAQRRAWRGEHELELTKLEFNLLAALATTAPRVATRTALHTQVWGTDGDYMSNSLEVHVSQLRRKTEAHGGPRLLHTVRGVGYQLRPAG